MDGTVNFGLNGSKQFSQSLCCYSHSFKVCFMLWPRHDAEPSLFSMYLNATSYMLDHSARWRHV